MQKRVYKSLLRASFWTSLCSIIFFATNTFGQADEGRPAFGSEVGIKIMGAIVSKTKGRSVVLLKEIDSGKVKAMKVGNKISDTHPILKIQKNYIVVTKGEETLLLYKDKLASDAIAKAAAAGSAQASSGPSTYKEEGFERKDDGKSEISVKMTSSYRDNLVGNELQKVLMQATALPFYEEGKIIGFQLSQIDEGSIFDKGGFQNNDVITQINGIELDSIAGAIKLLKSLKGEAAISVQMQRDGVPRDMTISVD